ncbi:MAG: AbrB/MazE/SpoVT family DNA-binding domain-containing protein [Ignavibacteria bacterium]|jgi:AbrB family looped-hinge helix DNA binding protein|nr:AbrB/MazE/SpoVT family DNA-binding domain-containing protein [Ignavibacteria bacterium]MCU7526604.1 AbrB/MazE/SpoVT family DNA-binding domain-containing protein [Ignavibacteria bacterium]
MEESEEEEMMELTTIRIYPEGTKLPLIFNDQPCDKHKKFYKQIERSKETGLILDFQERCLFCGATKTHWILLSEDGTPSSNGKKVYKYKHWKQFPEKGKSMENKTQLDRMEAKLDTLIEQKKSQEKDRTYFARSIDNLGRMVIPRDLRNKMGIKVHDTLKVYQEGDRIIVEIKKEIK